MRDLFDQDRPLTLGAIKLATGVFGLLIFVTGIAYVFSGIGTMIGGEFFKGLINILSSIAVFFFMFLLIRLIGENIAAQHRLNDRLTVLGDDIRVRRAQTPNDAPIEALKPTTAKAKAQPAAKSKTKADS